MTKPHMGVAQNLRARANRRVWSFPFAWPFGVHLFEQPF